MPSIRIWAPESDAQNLKERQYSEDGCPEVAKYIEINDRTIKRNEFLEEFAQYLKRLDEAE